MTNFIFFFITTLGLIVCQTVIFPFFTWFSQSFDLLIITVLYLSIAYTGYGVVMAIVLIGGIMDSISGMPFFLHIFSYLWIYLIVKLFKQFVFQKSVVFILIISLVSVLIQQVLVAFSIFVDPARGTSLLTEFPVLLRQLLWGMLIIPPGVWFLNVLRENWFHVNRQVKKDLVRKWRG